jgi:predicted nucleic acid-binding protein
LRTDFQIGVHELIAPSIFPVEVAGALTKAERQKLIPIGDARPLLGRVLRTIPLLVPYEPLLDRAVDLSSQTRSGLYDCLYVALAERERCQVVTDDQKLIANLQHIFPFILPLATLP